MTKKEAMEKAKFNIIFGKGWTEAQKNKFTDGLAKHYLNKEREIKGEKRK